MKGIPIVTALTAYDIPNTTETILLVLNEALYFGNKLLHTLLTPNQMRAAGLVVQDIPRQFDPNSTHSIYLPGSEIVLPLELDGIISFFCTRQPTQNEIETCARFDLTASARWHPYSGRFAEQEKACSVFDVPDRTPDERLVGLATACVPIHRDDGDLAVRLIAKVHIHAENTNIEALQDDLNLSGFVMLRADGEDADRENILGDEPEGKIVAVDMRQAFTLVAGATEAVSRRSIIAPQDLALRWGIGLESAKLTLQATTQRGMRFSDGPFTQRYRTRQSHLRYPLLRTKMYTDTMFSKRKGLGGDMCGQIYVTNFDWIRFYPMRTKRGKEVGVTLGKLIAAIGIPSGIVMDGARETLGGDFKSICDEFHIPVTVIEPYSHWQNRAENAIKLFKRGVRRALLRTRTPQCLWNYCGQWLARVRCVTVHGTPQLDGRVPEEILTGNTPDISDVIHYDWYEVVYYHDPGNFPEPTRKLGRWLGPSHGVGQALCYWILTNKATIISRSTVQPLSPNEKLDPVVQANIEQLNSEIKLKIGDGLEDDLISDQEFDMDDAGDHAAGFYHGVEGIADGGSAENEVNFNRREADDFTPDTSLDNYLNVNVIMFRGGDILKGKVASRVRGPDGNPVGIANSNPILDSREYIVEFPDGSAEAYTANVIAESLYSQVDDEGREFMFMEAIIDHKKDGSAVAMDDAYIRSYNGTNRRRTTTQGWKLLVRWKDGSTTWEPLRNIKESNPVEVAEYAVANKLAEEPAFAWWIKDILRRRDRILSKVKTRHRVKTHQYGVELPKSVSDALRIDKETGTDFWTKAIEKEMKNVMIAFEFRDDDKMPVGYKHIDCHMIFAVKMDLTRKARLVAGGHQTNVPKALTYSSVVSRDSVRLAFLFAALNDLEVVAADIQNAYLYAFTKEKVYTTAGPEFGQNAGRPVLIVRALYGLKSSGAAFRNHLAQILRDIGFASSKADPDVWLRAATKSDGTPIYEYCLCYVDDVLAIVMEPKKFIALLQSKYTLKQSSVGEPTVYLGATIGKHYMLDSDDPTKVRWTMSSDDYIKRAVSEVQTELNKIGKMLPTKVATPMSPGYRPELDITAELDPRRASYYQGLIGVLRWACELGRIDILIDVSLLSSFLAAPREGHLNQLFHIFAYLKKYNRSKLVFDDTDPNVTEDRFAICDWTDHYPDAQEAIPPNAPEPRGNSVTVHCFVDASHAGCQVTRRSHTGVLIFVNRAPIIWYSKRQNTVEASTFGSEFIAMRTGLEMVEGLRYKLRMFGVPIDGPANIYCDNEGVVKNTTMPESTLKKKHVAICYHRIREASAAGIIRIAKEDTSTNLADIATKSLAGPALREMAGRIMW